MKIIKGLAVSIALATVTVTPQASAKVDVIQSSSAALAKGATFAWAPMRAFGTGVPDPAIANEITVRRLKTITENTLVSKGYKQADNLFDADLIIAYTIVMQPEADGKLTPDGAGCRGPLCLGASGYDLDTSQYTQGTLVLDLVERETGQLVWRATSKKRVTGKDISEKKLSALLDEMTRSLPLK